MRTSAALFPFCSQLLPFVKHFDELQNKYVLRRLVSPSGFGLTGRDAAYSCNHPLVGMTVTDALDPEDPTWDVLLLTRITDAWAEESIQLENEAERALRSGKSVLYFDSCSAGVPKKVCALSEAYPGRVHVHVGDLGTPADLRLDSNHYNHVGVPVVLVGGVVEEADTSEVLLRLTARLRADGFHVAAVSRHSIGELFGLHTLHDIFARKDLAEADKVQELNLFFKALEMNERPSVLVVEAPDALMRYSDFASNGFGIRTYMVCQAVCPDFLICCVPCEMAVGRFLDTVSSDFEHRLGSPIHAAHVSNLVVDSLDVMQTHSISYVHTDLETALKRTASESEDSSIPRFDIVGDGIEGLYVHLCNAIALGKRG